MKCRGVPPSPAVPLSGVDTHPLGHIFHGKVFMDQALLEDFDETEPWLVIPELEAHCRGDDIVDGISLTPGDTILVPVTREDIPVKPGGGQDD